MPSHHHRETNRCCCCCSIHPSPPPHLTTSDQLLQALASHLLLQSQNPPTLSDRHCLKPQQHSPPLHSFFQIHQLGDDHLPPVPPHYHRHEHQQQQQQQFYRHQAQPLIESLLRRVAALESSFPHLSSPTSSPSPLPCHGRQRQERPLTPSPPSSFALSLRDLAARRIQASYRRFLLRRSQTLRHLKDLAAMKSSSGDPMVREGKRSISRELVRMLDFIDKVAVKEHQLSLDAIEITGNCGVERDSVEGMRREIVGTEEVQKLAKKVSFLEDGKRPRFSLSGRHQLEEELIDAGNQTAPLESLGGDITSTESSDHLGPERFHEISNGDRSSESSIENGGKYVKGKHFQNQNGK
ncbi:hypothetical protein C4D60_Mb04t35070 [Musa balbisiana]|uniref:BAG domain-containing protein n=1 Tax=Musa balbisiana TaxID=52838 RepID=A0A4S8KHG7_MUSBA|nr:hypothetical protein C4D60_Mb04t35070 [Musa balbisiana]